MSFTRPEVQVNTFRKASFLEATILENKPLVAGNNELADVRHITFDAPGYDFLEGQSVGVLPPGQTEAGKNHAVRLYSISSMGNDVSHNEKLSVTVKRVVYTNENNEKVFGVCSNYLASLQPGDKVHLTGPAGRKFLLPVQDELDRPFIFIATGTGIAPFRGMLQRLCFDGRSHDLPVHLFFGVKTTAELLYIEELKQFASKFKEFHLHIAVSREQQNDEGGRLYVHHLFKSKADQIKPLLENEKSIIYLCGLKGMETGVHEAIGSILNIAPDSIKESFGDRLQTEVY